MRTIGRLLLLVGLVLGPATALEAQTGAARALDHDAYDIWNRISGQALSADGRFLLYSVGSSAADGTLRVRATAGGVEHTVERGEGAQFTSDGRFAVFRLRPTREAQRAGRQARGRGADAQPQDSLGILDNTTGQLVARVPRIASFKLPDGNSRYVAYLHTRSPAERPDTAAADSLRPPQPGQMPEPPVSEQQARAWQEQQQRQQVGQPPAAGGAQEPRSGPAHRRDEGATLVLLDLTTRAERRIEDVTQYELSGDGARLVYITQGRDGSGDGVHVLDTGSGAVTTLLAGRGAYRQLTLDEDGRQAAFISNRDTYDGDRPVYTLYHWDGRAATARAVVSGATPGLPADWVVSESGSVAFSPNGARLLLGTAPRPPAPRDTATMANGEPRVVLDVWSWTDPLLQPMQLRQLEQERRRSYQAVVHLRDGRFVQLATEEMPDVAIAQRGDGDVALGRSNLPYRHEISWGESGSDVYLVDVRNGQREMVMRYARGAVTLSPDARYIVAWDGDALQWNVLDTRTKQLRPLSTAIPFPVHNELHDSPSLPNAYGIAGWTPNDAHVLIYDRYDVWAVDPTGRAAPRNVTAGTGRREDIRFRLVRLDLPAVGGFGGGGGRGGFGQAQAREAIDPSQPLLFSAFHMRTKEDGFYRGRFDGAAPARLVMMPKRFGTPRKADDADVLLFTRMDFREFPDLWVSGMDFTDMRQMSTANPQQQEYRWGSAELVEWRDAHGEPLQGVLYTPDGFDPAQQYPLMVYFYERLSDNLHGYVIPAAGGSSINISFYVSRGYLVFTPDIPYRIGYPGESALHAVVPGVLSLLERGYIDRSRIGVQGHSWGGYQIAYMITKTNLFAAAEAGAPVANMISAYGGIRWSTGMSRMFQYERTQSRLGGTLWDAPMRYIENSPIFWADKVETPLLMMHNDEDGAVPWEQGIEYFVALRRLGKPVWMLNYNGEDHGLRQEHNRKDWAVRMQQFFDHYLLGAPAPVWMAEGVPASRKGETLGLELVEPSPPLRPVSEQNGGRSK
jgi:dienelactone hydrolase